MVQVNALYAFRRLEAIIVQEGGGLLGWARCEHLLSRRVEDLPVVAQHNRLEPRLLRRLPHNLRIKGCEVHLALREDLLIVAGRDIEPKEGEVVFGREVPHDIEV